MTEIRHLTKGRVTDIGSIGVRFLDAIHDNPAANNHASGIDPYTGRFVKSMSKEFKPEAYGRGGVSARENSNHPSGTRYVQTNGYSVPQQACPWKTKD